MRSDATYRKIKTIAACFGVPLVVLWLVSLTPTSLAQVSSIPSVVNPKDIRSLMVGPKDIPWDVCLMRLSREKYPLTSDDKHALDRLIAHWHGPPGGPGLKHHEIKIEVVIFGSPNQAFAATAKNANSFAVRVPLTTDKRVVPYADRGAWVSKGCIRFSRKNVSLDIWARGSGSHDKDAGVAKHLANLIAHKVDAAASGKPVSLPTLPPAYSDMFDRVNTTPLDRITVWSPQHLNKYLLLPARNTIFLKCRGKPAAALVVDKISDNDAMVSLQALQATVGKKRAVKVAGNKARALFAGRIFVFTDGSPIVTVGTRAMKLSRSVRFAGYDHRVLLPLSFVETSLGKHIRWEKGVKIWTANI